MSQSEDIKAAARRALAPIAEDMLEVERIIMREVSSAVSRVTKWDTTSQQPAASACAPPCSF